ncbi:MAG: aminotransferase class I/II-fold pyridoxal phosphate-dependent enzyme [Acetobacter sp.]|nr:aminotransferase class I/II-fold pyridoxal phosphate-dependent enzyme [Bacteroides sp.]MCM1341922.1 aminotransferase class I/II-fold pyridoxal phosphate-dependent enzyme [Acetobacter sp.]MCM1434106.1 aminotransferase class I/II-fold pyridoxal phosphate-dependent enzyme [Clostridiales bacterium]
MSKKYSEMTTEELLNEQKELLERYNAFKAKELKLDMSRGKPGADQLDLSMNLYDVDNYVIDGMDVRNYGLLDGIPSCKKLFADLMGVEDKNVIIGPSASLNLMFDYICQCYTHGAGSTPWCKLDEVKFLCPVPGYDRHFTICEHFGIKMINVPMLDDGPDMDIIEELVEDESVKGIFCVPKYSNPQGITFSDEVVERMAALNPAADDFRIIWDNAYCVHDLTDDGDELLNIFDVLPKYNNEDMVIEVCSTSKMTFPGAGVSAIIASDNNIAAIKKRLNAETISYDKMNQLRHVKFFKNADGIKEHMKKHAAIMKPKFDIVLKHLNNELGDKDIAKWFNPKGGYFISLDVMSGCAKRTGELCKEAGVTLTSVGATFPYGIDENDTNIRIAPSFPPVDELDLAAELLCICVRIACVEKLLSE